MRTTRAQRGADAGITIIELLVVMSVLSVVMSMFTGVVLQMYRGANQVEAMTTAQSRLNNAFLRLDKDIRYAAEISAPATVNGHYYVEYLLNNTGTARCGQLRLNVTTRVLEHRSWVQGVSTSTPIKWYPLASDVTATNPFTVLDASDDAPSQKLRIRLRAHAGGSASAASRPSEFLFAALNPTAGAPTPTVCTEGRQIPGA